VSRLSYKTLLLIVVFLLIPIVFLLRLNQKATPASAGWFDEGWNYRKAVDITNSVGTTLTDFQVSISIGTSALITAGKMQSDCDDIRVTDVSGKLLPHWIEENNPGCNTPTDTKVWVKVPNIPSSGGTVYLYYGNPSAANVGDGNKVFEFFDDFNDNQMNSGKWNIVDQAGALISSETSGVYRRSGTVTQSGKFSGLSSSNISLNSTRIVEGRVNVNSYSASELVLSFDPQGNGVWIRNVGTGYKWQYWNGSWTTIGDSVISTGGTAVNVKVVTTTSSSQIYENDTLIGTRTYSIGDTNALITQLRLFNTNDTGSVDIDNIRVRKYASTDTSSSLSTTEEQSKAPIAYWKFNEGVGTTVYDSSSSNNNGALGTGTSAPTWQTEDQCISGKCLFFNGQTNFISISNSDSLNVQTGNLSISAWIKKTGNLGIGDSNQTIIAKGNGASTFTYILVLKSTNKVNFSLYDGTNNPSVLSNTIIQNDTWYHVVGTYDGTNLNIYVNGIFDNSSGRGSYTTAPTKNSTVEIGMWPYQHGTRGKFYGYIDEPKIYPYARTAAEIKQDYNLGASALIGHKQEIAQVTPIKSKLVGYWKFNEGYGTILNNSGNGGNTLNGTMGTGTSAPTWTNDGRFGKALSFGGNDYVSITDSTDFDISSNGFTYSAWINGSNFPDTLNMFMGHFLPYFCVRDTGKLYVSFTDGTQRGLMGTTVLNPNQWYHAVATYDSSGYLKIYLNGELDSIGGPYGTVTNQGGNQYIGKWYSGSTYFFTGLIDEVKIYNYALTADEIKLDYNQGSAMQLGNLSSGTGNTAPSNAASQEYCVPGDTATCSPPIAEWKFEEGLGTTAYNTSGNNNHGVFGSGNSAPTWFTGKIGKALSFDGSNDIVDTGSTFASLTDSFTVSAWVKPSSSQVAYADIFGNHSNDFKGFVCQQNNTTTNQYVCTYGTGTSWVTSSSANLTANIWQHFTFTKQSTGTKIFVNGTEIGSTTSASSVSPSAYTLKIGQGYASGGRHFNGLIDQVRIYDYARSPAQIVWDYNRGGPIAQYKFDECQGTIAHDSIGTNNGTINIGTSVPQTTVGTCNIGTTDSAWFNGATGKTNASLNFDGGDDDVSLASNISLPPANSSVSWWMKRPASRYEIIFSRLRNGTCGYISVTATNGITIESYTNNIWQKTLATGINTSDNIWHHYTLSFSPTDSSLYVDGKFASSTTANSDTVNFVIRYFGSQQSQPSYGTWLNGQIDDVQIFNYALTATQAKTLYNGGSVNFR
jgi:hypothetical protein